MNVYEQLGLKCIINASGMVTRLGGAPMPAEVQDAFREAAAHSVPLDLLQAAACREIAQICDTEAGLVTAGCAAALTLGTAAILSGSSLSRMERLPNSDGIPNEFIIAREQRSGYDHAVRAAGAKLVEVGFNEIVSNAGVRRTETWEYEAAFNSNSAGVLYVHSPHSVPPLAEVVTIAHAHNLPVLVDAAGELPPRENLRAIAASGADLVAFSGGKAIAGPQSTGILCGKQPLIASAAMQMLDMDDHFELWNQPPEFAFNEPLPGIPRHGIGRSMKVSKEEIVALLTALKRFAAGEFLSQHDQFRTQLETLAGLLKEKAVECKLSHPSTTEQPACLQINLQGSNAGNAFNICQQLRQGNPPVYVGHAQLEQNILVINPQCIQPAQYANLALRLQEELQ